MAIKHLWEADHSYYCSETNFFLSANRADETVSSYRSWEEFLADSLDDDMDMNLLFRWDWLEGEENDLPPFNGDSHFRNGKLLLFTMCQRIGYHRCEKVDVCRADEPAVIEFLRPRLAHLMSLWSPLTLAA